MRYIKSHNIMPYLPYLVRMGNIDTKVSSVVNAGNLISDGSYGMWDSEGLILRPMSDVSKKVIKTEKGLFSFLELATQLDDDLEVVDGRLQKWNHPYYEEVELNRKNFINGLPYYLATELFKFHFDCFGLIERGLAISSADWED